VVKVYLPSSHIIVSDVDVIPGACFAIEDATILANALLNNPPSSENGRTDFFKTIKEYTEARVPRSKSMTRQSYYTALLGMSDRWWWRWLRDFATALIPMGGDPKMYVISLFKIHNADS
jgi:FAD-dependent urate hydroxylase